MKTLRLINQVAYTFTTLAEC